ncbi:MAG TPA: dihydrofolate reductase family protein [Flavisolibacter sp.]|jgi:dihydrofolate reductase|nr:dihydrofolate reductase family protein [Flavisolibacter sp.]
MRKIILQVAVSIDGFIEGPNGEIDWCFTDQDYGMKDFFKQIDTLFMGRKTYELMLTMGEDATSGFPKLKQYVFSTTLNEVQEGIIVGDDLESEVEKIRNEQGKDIWLFGGGNLTTSFMNLKLVDEVWLAVHPVILGGGKPLFDNLNERVGLKHLDTKTYSTGLVFLKYAIA